MYRLLGILSVLGTLAAAGVLIHFGGDGPPSASWTFLLIVTVIGGLGMSWAFAWSSEHRDWNYGWCPRCDVRWKAVAHDYHGTTCFECPSCRKSIWITYALPWTEEPPAP